MSMEYIIAKKIKEKWYGLAGCNLGPKSCLAEAADIFNRHGWNEWKDNTLKITWGSIENQKNYAGRLPEFMEVQS